MPRRKKEEVVEVSTEEEVKETEDKAQAKTTTKKEKALEDEIIGLLRKDKDLQLEVGYLHEYNANPTRWLDTGSYTWNWLSSGSILKGLPYGRVIEVYGESGTGKSLMGSQLAAMALLDGAVVVYFDVEYALDEPFVARLGADPSKIVSPQRVKTIETFDGSFSKILTQAMARKEQYQNEGREPRPMVVILDSLAQLSSKQEMEKPDKNDMTKHRKIRSFFRRYMFDCADTNILFVVINQVYEDINQTYGDNRVASGGKGLTFAASIRFLINSPTKINKEINGKKVLIGSSFNMTTKKNRLSIPFRTASFTSTFSKGVDKIGGLIELLKGYGLIKVTGGRYTFPKLLPKIKDKEGKEKHATFSKVDFTKMIEAKPELLEKIDTLLKETVEEVETLSGGFEDEDITKTTEELNEELSSLGDEDGE